MSALMRFFLVIAALAMPLVSGLTQSEIFGGSVAAESNRFPTLLVPAAYAFVIWGLIFLLDIGFAAWQLTATRARDPSMQRLLPWATAGFALTAAWVPVFTQRAWVSAVIIIWASLLALLVAALLSVRAAPGSPAASWIVRVPLALHSGWLSLAAFVNTAQLLLALEWTTTSTQWPASVGLWIAAAVLLLWVQRKLAASPIALLAYSASALWGLVGVVVEQRTGALPGAQASAGIAMVLIGMLTLHGLWLQRSTFKGMASSGARSAQR